jgi:hypothetical protein
MFAMRGLAVEGYATGAARWMARLTVGNWVAGEASPRSPIP